MVYQDKGPVVQLDCRADNQLLVSLWTRCVMLTVGQRAAEVTQVGKKLRYKCVCACMCVCMCTCLLLPWLEKVYRGIYFTKFIRVHSKLMISCPDYVIIAINHMIVVLENQSQ